MNRDNQEFPKKSPISNRGKPKAFITKFYMKKP